MDLGATLDDDLEQYEVYVTEGLDDPANAEIDALLALILRDSLETQQERMTADQRARLRELDDLLVAKRERVTTILPHPNVRDRARWWWFLHEGPQVREEALAAARAR